MLPLKLRALLPLRLTLPPPPGILALVGAAFILPGLAGHDLWKTQDAIALGIVHAMATSGDLVVPRLGGAPWLYDQPLYHWLPSPWDSSSAGLSSSTLRPAWLAAFSSPSRSG